MVENKQTEEITREINQPPDLTELLRANLERSEEILEISKSIKRYIRWQQFWGISRLLLIAIPLIIGFIYLPPLIREAFDSYKSVLMP